MLKFTMSDHAKDDRCDRITTMLTEIGYNSIIFQGIDKTNPEHTLYLTDTGILFIVGTGNNVLVTAYLISTPKLCAIYEGKNPPSISKRVKRNEKLYPHLFNKEK